MSPRRRESAGVVPGPAYATARRYPRLPLTFTRASCVANICIGKSELGARIAGRAAEHATASAGRVQARARAFRPSDGNDVDASLEPAIGAGANGIAELVSALLEVWAASAVCRRRRICCDTGSGRSARRGGCRAALLNLHVGDCRNSYCEEALFVASLFAEALLARVTSARFLLRRFVVAEQVEEEPPLLLPLSGRCRSDCCSPPRRMSRYVTVTLVPTFTRG